MTPQEAIEALENAQKLLDAVLENAQSLMGGNFSKDCSTALNLVHNLAEDLAETEVH